MTVAGPQDAVDRAAAIAVRMIEAARQRRELTPDDVLRLGDRVDRGDTNEEDDGAAGNGAGGPRIALPGIRKVIVPKTAGQTEYLKKIGEATLWLASARRAPARRISPLPRLSTR